MYSKYFKKKKNLRTILENVLIHLNNFLRYEILYFRSYLNCNNTLCKA